LSTRLDPEDLREVVRTYHHTCANVIHRHEGHIAQYLGDGLLVYFGYPVAHEDDARRAVRAGVEIVEALKRQEGTDVSGRAPLQVRIGIHTGVVVIGEMGAAGHTEQLALGDTPNIAARLQALAEPNTVLISAPTYRLLGGQFECQPFGSHLVKGLDTPIAVYHVQSERQNLSSLAGKTTLTPLVGRDQEVGLLVDRWEQVKEGQGQVILLSGEPGIGKSRLAHTLKEHVTTEGSLLFEARCSPYHQHSALYPLIESLQRLLLLTCQDTEAEKVTKLERVLALYGMQDTLPLFTALLSLPTPAQYPSLALTPQKQKEHTLQALLQLVVAQAERQATVLVWEDLHWADPSSLEFLTLLIEQIPTTKLFLVLTFRPEFTPPWKPRSHISQLVLNRLGKRQVEAMIEQVTAGKELAPEIIEQIRLKVEAEILYQRGVGEQARYFFKHALIQDTAYQSLLKSTRQQYHQRIARVLEEQFPDTKDLQEAKALLVELEHRAIRSLKD
jgi:class 3 adenylate cyclase